MLSLGLRTSLIQVIMEAECFQCVGDASDSASLGFLERFGTAEGLFL
jgi:hypothetical protein